MPETSTSRVAILLPCYNEENAIGRVVHDFRRILPDADIYVYDNNSTDATVREARNSGAIVRSEPNKGKGNVVRRMFADIDADYYLMADGDGTYDAESALLLLQACQDDRLAMVIGCRESADGHTAYRSGHVFGNRMLNALAGLFFSKKSIDMMSGYRVFTRQFVKSFPALSSGFEIETEMTVHALSLNIAIGEVKTPYFERAASSHSKLNTYRDGIRILMVMVRLFKDFRPLLFFSITSALLGIASIILFLPVLTDYLETGFVARIPTVVLCTGLFLTAMLSMFAGLLLDSGSRQSIEIKRLAYLAQERRL